MVVLFFGLSVLALVLLYGAYHGGGTPKHG